MEAWRTALVDSGDGHIRMRGYDVTALMASRTFTDVVFLLHLGRLPSETERLLLDAILIGVADHGAGAPSCAAARLPGPDSHCRRLLRRDCLPLAMNMAAPAPRAWR
jgi:citrate synthase